MQTLIENGREKTVGQDVTVAEILPEILADEPYYRRSGGGVTLSGGEILGQHKFAAALLAACQENGLHTAIESSAYAPYEKIAEILPHLDLYLMDIKHMDSAKHKEYTGVPNELILENAKRVAESGTPLIIRTPVVPTVNDNAEDIRAIARFAAKIGAQEYHLLPYHRLGTDKYIGLGRQYAMTEIQPPPAETMEYLLSVAEESGIKCQIGG